MTQRTPVSGQQLLADFRTAFLTAATSEAARYEVTQSENALLSHLQTISSGYLQPAALAVDDPDALSRASLDAHIKKIQAKQFEQLSASQLTTLQQQAAVTYIGRHVHISVTMPVERPIESIRFDPVTGYRNSPTTRRTVSGTIEEIALDRNLLIIRPPRFATLFNSRLQGFVIFIVDPKTFMPMVDIRFS